MVFGLYSIDWSLEMGMGGRLCMMMRSLYGTDRSLYDFDGGSK